jgi:hypothetical protein
MKWPAVSSAIRDASRSLMNQRAVPVDYSRSMPHEKGPLASRIRINAVTHSGNTRLTFLVRGHRLWTAVDCPDSARRVHPVSPHTAGRALRSGSYVAWCFHSAYNTWASFRASAQMATAHDVPPLLRPADHRILAAPEIQGPGRLAERPAHLRRARPREVRPPGANPVVRSPGINPR